MGARLLIVLTLIFAALPAGAQQGVKLQFDNGLVTLRAENAPVRSILAEWARLGGATIVNGDRVTGPPVTLELAGVPERQALDIVLRNVAGYMIAPRRAGAAGASAFDRIMILPTSVAPRNAPPPSAAAAGPRPVLPRPAVIARPPEAPPLEPSADSSQVDDAAGEPEAQTPQQIRPGDPRGFPRPLVRRPVPPGVEAPADEPDGDDQGQSAGVQDGVAPTPANPFGVPFGSSSTPGVIAPVQRQQPQQQTSPNRVQ